MSVTTALLLSRNIPILATNFNRLISFFVPRSGFDFLALASPSVVAMAEGVNIGGGAGTNRWVFRFLLDEYRRAKFPPPRNPWFAA